MTGNPYELIYMIRQGDEYAQKELMHQYMPMVKAVVNNCISVNPNLKIYKDDLVQEGIIAMMEALGSYRENSGGLSSFLSTVVRRRALQLLRHYQCQKADGIHNMYSLDYMVKEDDPVYDLIPQSNHMLEPEYALRFQEAQTQLYDIIHNLDNMEQLVMHEWMTGESYEVCAKRMGITLKAYDGRLQRLKRKLYQIMK